MRRLEPLLLTFGGQQVIVVILSIYMRSFGGLGRELEMGTQNRVS